ETLLALAAGEDGIFIWDIKTPGSPVLMARTDTPGDALGIDFNDTQVFVADEFDLAVFDRLPFSADSTPPSIQITSPVHMDRITEKTVSVWGTAADGGSGVRRVEVSADGGETWLSVFGQEQWSHLGAGYGTGPVAFRARAVDWSGNTGPESPATWVYFDPPRPRILVAGFESTAIETGRPADVTVSAIVQDPWDEIYIGDADMYLNGDPLDGTLENVSGPGAYRYYRLIFNDTFTGTGFLDLSITFRDIYGNPSAMWPQVPVKW
ncbi:MAG TPA: Ig-like domain-containing protein, partial [bacterium]|nr:Ig-like domain-containing protein [bacterium]